MRLRDALLVVAGLGLLGGVIVAASRDSRRESPRRCGSARWGESVPQRRDAPALGDGGPHEHTERTTINAACGSDTHCELARTPGSSNEPYVRFQLPHRLLWLSSIADRRHLAAIWAVKEVVTYMYLEAGVSPPGHVLQLTSALWGVAFALSEAIDRGASA